MAAEAGPGEKEIESFIQSDESLDETVDKMLSISEREGPPGKVMGFVPEEDWKSFNHIIAENIVKEDRERDVLEEAEKAGSRLLLSPDQKRLRPSIGMIFYDWLGSDIPRDQAQQLMTAPEVVHVYTKGIDDDMDNDFWRNGFPTVGAHMSEMTGQKELGGNLALDYWLDVKSRNYDIIDDLDTEWIDSEEKQSYSKMLRSVESDLSDGQSLDLAGAQIGKEGFEVRPNYLGGDEDMMEYTHQTNRGKTAALFGLIGKYAQELTDYEGKELEEWGLEAGEAFQITDDILDLKTKRFSDIENNNYTVPIALAERYLHSHPDDYKNSQGAELTDILRSEENDQKELERAYDIIENETMAIETSEQLAKTLTENAIGHLNNIDLEGGEYRQKVEAFTRLMGYQREK